MEFFDTAQNHYLSHMSTFRKMMQKLWSQSKFCRITALVTGSITGYLSLRYLYIKGRRKYYGLPPGMVGMPIIGHAALTLNMNWLSTVPGQYGDVTSIRLMGGESLLINDPVLAKKLHDDPRVYNSTAFETNMNFLHSTGKTWSDRRRIIQSNLMSTMKSDFVENATKRFISSKVFPVLDRDIAHGKATELKPLLRPMGFNIVLQASYGKELESLNSGLWAKWEAMRSDSQRHALVTLIVVTALGMRNRISIAVQRMLTGSDSVSDFNRVIDFVDTLEDNAIDVDVEKDEHVRLFSDFVDEYLEMENGRYSKKDLHGDMMTMFGAAIDTTYSALSFALLELAKDSELQQELHDEVVAAFGDNVEGIKLKIGISKIPKLRAFIHEVLRIHPPAPAAGLRRIKEDGLKVGEYNIAKGTVMPRVNIVAIHRNPKYWIKDYDVEKHRNVNMKDIHLDFWMEDGAFVKKKQSANFFTFGTGKRGCPGQALAMKEIVIVLAMVLMKYKVNAPNGSKIGSIEYQFGELVIEPTVQAVLLQHRKDVDVVMDGYIRYL